MMSPFAIFKAWRLLLVLLAGVGCAREDSSTNQAALEAAEEIHWREIEQVLEHVRPDMPTVIAGDFNSCSPFAVPSLLRERGWIDSFAAVHKEPDTHPTWRWPTRYGEARLRIDYLFHTPSLRTIDSRVIRSDGSDHSLLVSELAPAERPAPARRRRVAGEGLSSSSSPANDGLAR